MVAFILPANSATGGYEIDNSLRFNEDDSAYLSKTFGSEGSKRTMTFSFWIKRGEFGDERYFLYSAGADANNRDAIATMDESLDIIFQRNDTTYYRLRTNRLFRDPSAWYHIVVAIDTTDGTSSNRIKLYVNGVQESSFATSDYPTQNLDLYFNDDIAQTIGRYSQSDSDHWDGHIADFYFIDGTQYAASNFGETDDNGVWIPKEFAGTFGSNGYFLEFQQTGTSANASGKGADTSGNGNHWDDNGMTAEDITTDTPTNNFMTMNPLFTNSRGAFAEGNLKVTTNVQGSVPYGQVEFGNFAVNKGKWYYEAKVTSVGSGGSLGLGWNERAESGGYTNGHNNGGSAGNVRYNSGGVLGIGSSHSQSTGVDSFTDNDIIGFALDLDNNKVYAYKNGNPQDDPTPDPDDNDGRAIVSAYNNYWTPWMSKDDTTNNATVEFNFGNPSFSISSGNADGNGYGNFEYAVPSGYYALCTKNLAEYG
mgnify:CR=1 FL=1